MTMFRSTTAVFAACLAVMFAGGAAQTQETKTAGDLVVSQAWSRATPGGAKVAGGFVTIENKGASNDRLMSATTEAAARSEVHEMATTNGVMTMHPVDGVAIDAGKTVKLAPGSFHLMFFDPAKPLKQGDSFPVTLSFEKAGKVTVDFAVLGIGAQGPSGAAAGGAMHDQSKMPK